MKVEDYIESGILETFVMGAASDDETKELMFMKARFPEVNEALQQLELDMELLARNMAIMPPPNTWGKIEQEINDIILRDKTSPGKFTEKERGNDDDFKQSKPYNNGHQYIEVEAESSHMKISKSWKWVFAGIFVLGKIFLACAIYFYLENRQAQQQLQELKTELRRLKK